MEKIDKRIPVSEVAKLYSSDHQNLKDFEYLAFEMLFLPLLNEPTLDVDYCTTELFLVNQLNVYAAVPLYTPEEYQISLQKAKQDFERCISHIDVVDCHIEEVKNKCETYLRKKKDRRALSYFANPYKKSRLLNEEQALGKEEIPLQDAYNYAAYLAKYYFGNYSLFIEHFKQDVEQMGPEN